MAAKSKSSSNAPFRNHGLRILLEIPRNKGFNHGFKVVQDFVHPQYGGFAQWWTPFCWYPNRTKRTPTILGKLGDRFLRTPRYEPEDSLNVPCPLKGTSNFERGSHGVGLKGQTPEMLTLRGSTFETHP